MSKLYYLVLLDCFPLFMHFLTFLVKLIFLAKVFPQTKAGWGRGGGRGEEKEHLALFQYFQPSLVFWNHLLFATCVLLQVILFLNLLSASSVNPFSSRKLSGDLLVSHVCSTSQFTTLWVELNALLYFRLSNPVGGLTKSVNFYVFWNQSSRSSFQFRSLL